MKIIIPITDIKLVNESENVFVKNIGEKIFNETDVIDIIKKSTILFLVGNSIVDLAINNKLAASTAVKKINNKGKAKLTSLFWEDIDEIEGISKSQFDELVEQLQQAMLSKEKKENLKGNYKNADLLKMHAYKDAIRRTNNNR